VFPSTDFTRFARIAIRIGAARRSLLE
jgi:hypothetical protein